MCLVLFFYNMCFLIIIIMQCSLFFNFLIINLIKINANELVKKKVFSYLSQIKQFQNLLNFFNCSFFYFWEKKTSFNILGERNL